MSRNWPETIHTYYDSIQKFRGLNPFNKHRLHHNKNGNPFFIIGSVRSGNTLLRRILVQAPGIHIPPETYVLRSLVKLFRQNNHLRWPQLVNLMLSNIEYHPEFDTFRLKNLRPLAQQLYETPEYKQSLAYIIDSFYRFHAAEMGKTCERWGDKTPLNTLFLDRIHSVFPDAQYVNIVRDGYDVVYSYLNTGLCDDIERAANRWQESIIKADQFIKGHKSSVVTIRYEELTSEPRQVVHQICDFLNIPYSESMLTLGEDEEPELLGDVEMREHHYNVKKPITTDSIGKGRRNLTEDQKKRLNVLIGNKLEEKGYDLFK